MEYDFTVADTPSTFSLQLKGQWSASSNVSSRLTKVTGPSSEVVGIFGPSGAATLPGDWVTIALAPGNYEFFISQTCLTSGLSSTGGHDYSPLNLAYIAKIET